MSLTIDLSPEQEAALRAKAESLGLTVEAFVKQRVEGECVEDAPMTPRDDRPIWQVISEYVNALSPDTFDDMPTDGASEHDHYLYGSPKKDQ